MSEDNNPEPRTGSYAALDRRVARLEDQFDKVDSKVDDIQRDLAVMKSEQHISAASIMGQLAAITSEQTSQRLYLQKRIEEGYTIMADPASTPAGRHIMGLITDLKEDFTPGLGPKVDRLEISLAAVQRVVFIGMGAVMLLVLMLEIIAPIVLRFIFGMVH